MSFTLRGMHFGGFVLVAVAAATLGLALAVAVRAQPGGDRAEPADVAEASTVLGRPMPEVRAAGLNLKRSGIGIDPPGRPASRQVHISYAIDGKNVVLLNVYRGSISAEGDETFPLPGATASVATRTIFDGTLDMRYAWNRDGLAFVLHVNLSRGLTRASADQIARSVR